MAEFRKGDCVTVEAVVEGDFIRDGKIKIRVEPYHDIYANVSDLTMKCPTFVVGDIVSLPEKGFGNATVLAIGEDHLWVSLGGGDYATWYAPLVQRVAPEPEPEPEPEAIEIPPSAPPAPADALDEEIF